MRLGECKCTWENGIIDGEWKCIWENGSEAERIEL